MRELDTMKFAPLSQVWGLKCPCCREHNAALAVPPPPEPWPPKAPHPEATVEGEELEEEQEDEQEYVDDERKQQSLPACRHFARSGNCFYGDACRFRHEIAATPGCFEPARRTWGGKRRVVRKCGKAGALRRFLLQTFGHELLSQGEGVLDIAGGNGELAFLLVNLNGVRTTVVDPRPLRVDRFAKKLRWGVYHATEPLQSFNSEQLPTDGTARAPGHLRAFFDAALIDPLIGGDAQGFQQALHRSCQQAAKVNWTSRGIELQEEDDGHFEVSQVSQIRGDDTEDEIEMPSSEDVERLLLGASCIVGLHPDQPAGAAIDLALALGKPAAVVPCCVYASEFPERRLPCGAPVRHPDDLVAWILAKDPRLQEATLPFEGRNRVVYFDPRGAAAV